MLLRALFIPAILISGFALTTDHAEASPFSVGKNLVPGGRIYVSGQVVVPVERRARVRRARVRHVGGYYKTVYETRIERVWHRRELIGYDSHGHAVFSAGHWDEVEVQVPVRVWVPRRTVVRRRAFRRPVGRVAIGGAVRIR